MLVKNIKLAKKFTEEQLEYFNMDSVEKSCNEIYCEDEDKMISITHSFEKNQIK